LKFILGYVAAFFIGLSATAEAQTDTFVMRCTSPNGSAEFTLDLDRKVVSSSDAPHIEVHTLHWDDNHISWVITGQAASNGILVMTYLLELRSGVVMGTAIGSDQYNSIQSFSPIEYVCRTPI
jgi:hypothetical protein